MFDHFNNMRSYALGDEKALLMASWPRGGRPKIPFPYWAEVMTGFEYTAAIGMLYEGMEQEGLQCIQNIRDRYDGRKRNPFDEAECGHHYARAMASWAAILAGKWIPLFRCGTIYKVHLSGWKLFLVKWFCVGRMFDKGERKPGGSNIFRSSRFYCSSYI